MRRGHAKYTYDLVRNRIAHILPVMEVFCCRRGVTRCRLKWRWLFIQANEVYRTVISIEGLRSNTESKHDARGHRDVRRPNHVNGHIQRPGAGQHRCKRTRQGENGIPNTEAVGIFRQCSQLATLTVLPYNTGRSFTVGMNICKKCGVVMLCIVLYVYCRWLV